MVPKELMIIGPSLTVFVSIVQAAMLKPSLPRNRERRREMGLPATPAHVTFVLAGPSYVGVDWRFR
jgi:hypothetical protein